MRVPEYYLICDLCNRKSEKTTTEDGEIHGWLYLWVGEDEPSSVRANSGIKSRDVELCPTCVDDLEEALKQRGIRAQIETQDRT